MIDVFGADHVATYPDVLAALKALDYDAARVKVLIHQFVTITQDGEVVKMSTRKANFITLDELIADVGADVVRYFFLMRTDRQPSELRPRPGKKTVRREPRLLSPVRPCPHLPVSSAMRKPRARS